MRSILTDASGQPVTVFNGSPPTDGDWATVADGAYYHPRDRLADHEMERYVLSKTPDQPAYSRTSAEMGVVDLPIVTIDAPDDLVNDGSTEATVTITNPGETRTATLMIDDLTETITLSNGERTETVTTTLPAGETISISVSGERVVDVAAEIEVVSP